MEKLMKVMIALGMALTLTHCAEKKENNNQAATPAGGSYYLNAQGQCVSTVNPAQIMPQNYCQGGVGGNGQYWINPATGQCEAYAAPNVPVAQTYCQGGIGIPQSCAGQYMIYCPTGITPYNGQIPQGCNSGMCSPQNNNCRGPTANGAWPSGSMYTQQGQAVICQ